MNNAQIKALAGVGLMIWGGVDALGTLKYQAYPLFGRGALDREENLIQSLFGVGLFIFGYGLFSESSADPTLWTGIPQSVQVSAPGGLQVNY